MRNVRITLLMIVFTLIAIGLVMIYSSTAIYAWEKFKDSGYFLKRHIMFLIVGALFSLLVMALDYRLLSKCAKILVIVSILTLVLLLVPGISREVSGAKRWFRLFGFSFQPSEFANLSVIIYVASFLSRRGAGKRIEYFGIGFLPPIIVLGMVSILILIQPDLGTVVALSAIVFIMIFAAGARLRHLLFVLLAALPFFYLVIFNVPYRRMRILSFLNPWGDPLGSGFQLIQSQIALGSGGLFGRGLGRGLQKLFYLPAAHTDFIFSVIGEELGFFATLGVVILFILFLIYGSKIIRHSQDSFGVFLGLGIVSSIVIKAAINIGVAIGAFPTKGLPLPFVSYGGSALIFDMVGVGLLLNIARFGEIP